MYNQNQPTQNNPQQGDIARLLNELLLVQSEKNAILSDHINTLASRVAWSELCFKRVEDSGVIHMAGVIRKMAKDLEMLQVNHNKLAIYVKTHLPPTDQGGHGESGSDSPLSTHLQKSMSKLGR